MRLNNCCRWASRRNDLEGRKGSITKWDIVNEIMGGVVTTKSGVCSRE